jgi:hypothetical protein
MNRIGTLAMTMVSLLFLGVALLAVDGMATPSSDPTAITSMPPLMPFMRRCRI